MIGTRLANRYEIQRELGRGGMGVVYLAHDPTLDREVAVKVIPPALLSSEAEARFRREAKVIARMDHPAVVVVYDIGEHEGSLFFVMPYVPGSSLRQLMQDRSLQLGETVEVGIHVAEALEYSHSLNVIHRDIKPENILVTREERGGVRVRITDFGLARASSEHRLTRSGSVVGTVAYLSPEQVSEEEAGPASDIYSLGIVLYECLAGEPPFQGQIQKVLYRIAHEYPQNLRAAGVDVPEALETTILRCLEKDPARRFERAADLARELEEQRKAMTPVEQNRSTVSLRTGDPGLRQERPRRSVFVGREREMREIQQKLRAAIQGECQLVAVCGEAGMGKTRLLEELANLARVQKVRVLRGRFVEYDAFPYQGFCEVIQDHFRVRPAADITAAPDFSDLIPDLTTLFPVLLEIPEFRSTSSAALRLIQAQETRKITDRTYIFELLARALSRIGGGAPLVILMEDMHAADVSVEALQYAVRRLGPTPTLFVCTYRTTEIERRHPLIRMIESFQGDNRFVHLTLERWNASEHRAYLEAFLGAARFDAEFADTLYEATEGNPYFTHELMQSLIDAGRIVRAPTGWSLLPGTGVAAEQLPATIQLAVERRIERLPETLRDVLSVASILGKSFLFEDLEALAPEAAHLEDSVEQLLSTGFLEESRQAPDERLSFSSGVIRDVLYGELSRRKRRSLHRRFAEYLERRSAQTGLTDSRLLHHFAQGDVPEKVVQYGLKSIRLSLDAFGAEEAIRSARVVLEFLDEEIAEQRGIEAETRTMLARAYRMSGNIESSLKELGRVVRLLESPDSNIERLQAMALAAETAWAGRRTEEALRWVDRGLDDARQAPDTDVLSRLLSLGMTVANLRGDHARAQEYFEEAEALHKPAREPEDALPAGGRLVVAILNRIHTTVPFGIHLDEEEEVYSNVFETLLARDSRGALAPNLCERWESEPGGRSFVFQLRSDVRWSDGEPLAAAHVKRSLEHAARAGAGPLLPVLAPLAGIAEFREGKAPEIRGIEILSETAIRIRLTESLPIYPTLLTDVKSGVVRPENGNVLGTGPFLVESMSEGQLRLSRNSRYWNRSTPLLDSIDFRTGLSASEMARGLKSGEYDMVRDLLPQDLDEILRDHRFRAGMVEAPRKNVYFLLFNRSSQLGLNPMVRKALFGCIRTHDLVRRTLGRFAQPAECLFPPGILGHDPGRRPRTPLSREKVIELLQASRLFPPVRVRVSVHPLLADRYASLTQSLFQSWQEIGVEAEIVTPDMQSYQASIAHNEHMDLIFGRYVADYDDPDNFTYGLFHSQMGLYRNYFSARELDRWIEQARTEPDPSTREVLYERIESHVIDNHYLFPMFHDINYRIAGPRVRRLSLTAFPPYVNYTEIARVDETPRAERSSGGAIHIPMTGSLQSLDPSMAFLVEQSEVIPTVFETLTRVTEDVRTVPWLAAEFHAEEGGLKFHFRLRDDVRFHDGQRLTSRDVRYSFEHLLQNQASASRFLLSPIRGARSVLEGNTTDLEGFQIRSATEFSVELERPVSFFPTLLTHTPASIIPEGTTFGVERQPEEYIGTGPFRVVRLQPESLLELEPNPDYWREGLPLCDSLVFHFGTSPAEILDGFRSGVYTLAWGLMPEEVDALRRDASFPTRYGETPRLCTYYAMFNTHEGPLADSKLRHRIVRAVDVDGLVRRNLGRLAIPAHSLIPPGLLGHEPARRIPSPEKLSGDTEEIQLTGIINSVYEGPYSALASELLQTMQAAGFRVRIAHQSRSEYDRALVSGTADLVITRWVADYPDADNFAHSLIHTQEGIVGRLCGNNEIDSLIAQGRVESDPQKRHEVYRKVEEIIHDQALILPLFHEQAYCFARPEVEGFEISYSSPLVSYEKLRIAR